MEGKLLDDGTFVDTYQKLRLFSSIICVALLSEKINFTEK